MTAYVDRQTTLADQVTLTGIGVHSGKPASITLVPAEACVGVVFSRTDSDSSKEIPALWDKVSATALCTVLDDPSKDGISTVEHLMAALFGMGIDNVIVEIDGPEMPIMDGSSHAFVEAIEQVGIRKLDRGRRYLKVKKTVRVDNGSAWCELHPYDGTKFDITIDFDTPAIGNQKFVSDMTPDVFRNELCRARTFGYVKDVEQLWKMGFALGSSLENSVAISDDKVLNPEGTRWPDEFARHKALDAVGDLALAGLPILGLYRSFKGGHKMNHSILGQTVRRSVCIRDRRISGLPPGWPGRQGRFGCCSGFRSGRFLIFFFQGRPECLPN
jgi:UDP-3-O-[3-hydroxymyristoyl] N-acetylglucosamine deacetylase